MVAPAGSAPPAFAPAVTPRLAVSGDGSCAAVVEVMSITVVALPSLAVLAEIGVDDEAAACEVAWVATAAGAQRLLVLTRYAAHSTVHLVDPRGPQGPRPIAEIRLESPMRLYATVGAHALAVGALGAAVLTTGESHLTPYQFPARSVPHAAGAAASQFVVALAGAIEEWDPGTRMPKRRLKLPRPATITAVGGSERAVWMTTQQDPTRIDVMALVNRGQPKQHELPEPIARVSGHPRSDLLVCVGADTGKVYVVDLDGRARVRVVGVEAVERAEAAALIVGRMIGVVVAQARRPLGVLALDGREVDASAPVVPAVLPTDDDAPANRSTLYDEDDAAQAVARPEAAALAESVPEPVPAPPAAVDAAPQPAASPAPPSPPPAALAGPMPVVAFGAPKPSLFRAPAPSRAAAAAPSAAPVAAVAPAQSLSERFSLWRDRMRQAQPREGERAALPFVEERASWRDELVGWARGVLAGTIERASPAVPAIDALVGRFEVPAALAAAVQLLYGAHLGGEAGVAPVDIARVLGRRWDEALGRGLLAARGLATFERSRVSLAGGVQRALDELPPRTGVLQGELGAVALLGPCCVVADGPLAPIAARVRAVLGGAILVADDYAHLAEVLLEGRAYGAAPMLRIAHGDLDQVPAQPAILVVSDEELADALGVPRI